MILGGAAAALLLALALPVTGLRAAMPTTGVLPRDATARVGYERMQRAFGQGAPAELQVVAPQGDAGRVRAWAAASSWPRPRLRPGGQPSARARPRRAWRRAYECLGGGTAARDRNRAADGGASAVSGHGRQSL